MRRIREKVPSKVVETPGARMHKQSAVHAEQRSLHEMSRKGGRHGMKPMKGKMMKGM